jgi:hypothetical protein
MRNIPAFRQLYFRPSPHVSNGIKRRIKGSGARALPEHKGESSHAIS